MTVLPSLPSLPPAPAERKGRTSRPQSAAQKESDHVAVVKSLCKTYTHTVQKLMYVFAALKEEGQEAESTKAKSVSDAIANGKRDEMMEKIAQSLAGGVESILHANDVSLRSGVLRDLRARFAVKEPAAKVDAGVQAAPPREKKPKVKDDKEGGAEEARAAAPEQPKPAAAATAESGSEAKPTEGGDSARKAPRANSFAERQMQWELKKLAKIQEQRQDKESREIQAAPAVVRRERSSNGGLADPRPMRRICHSRVRPPPLVLCSRARKRSRRCTRTCSRRSRWRARRRRARSCSWRSRGSSKRRVRARQSRARHADLRLGPQDIYMSCPAPPPHC